MRWLALGVALGGLGPVPGVGQQIRMRPAAAEVLAVGAGQLILLKVVEDRIEIDGVVVESGPAIDLRRGDVIVELQGKPVSSLAELLTGYRALETASPVSLGIRRGGQALAFRFAKPAPPSGPVMAVTGSGGGAGAWTTTAGSDGATFGFLGAEIGENGEGLPEVVNRRAHPLGGTVGLRVGDVITGFNGGPISALAGLKMKYEAAAAGTRIVLKVRRASEIVEVSFVKQAS